jgi:hypothetical protein
VSDLPPPPSSFGAPPPGANPDVGAALSYGWNKFGQNAVTLLGIILVPLAVNIVLSAIGYAGGSLFLRLLINVVSFVVSTVAGLGIVQAALIITRGEPLDFGKAFQFDRWGEWFVFSIVYGLMVGLGLALCIVPGLFVIAFFGMAQYFVIDQRLSLGDALSASRQAAGNGYALPVLLCAIVGIAGVIACGFGVFVTMPIAYVAVGFLYRNAIGQAVAA